ncbi:MAG: hypothetical protein CM1200mP20_17030 [Pseudomonadota bacterium]|nr:MAG: hypothetical protein CM1200mP20_17030 [Pseudomonadota bacterium]
MRADCGAWGLKGPAPLKGKGARSPEKKSLRGLHYRASWRVLPVTNWGRPGLFFGRKGIRGWVGQTGRDKDYQAIMPLRGKILNTWEVESAEVLGFPGGPRYCHRARG